MRKTTSTSAVPAPATPVERAKHHRARFTMRAFAAFITTEDPELLASCASNVEGSLAACERIGLWFKRYAAALRSRRPH